MSEALRVLRHESELGTWELVTRVPEPRLRGLVCDYQGYVESGAPSPVLRQQVPTPRIPLIVNFGAPWNVADAGHAVPHAHESFVAGLGERSSYVRHLATRFGEQIGLRPKMVARILRFDRAVELLGRDDADLADVAFECGYYDQAHLNRDFREFAGKPPGVVMRQIVPDGGVVVSS